jgi:hypothetical protein
VSCQMLVYTCGRDDHESMWYFRSNCSVTEIDRATGAFEPGFCLAAEPLCRRCSATLVRHIRLAPRLSWASACQRSLPDWVSYPGQRLSYLRMGFGRNPALSRRCRFDR